MTHTLINITNQVWSCWPTNSVFLGLNLGIYARMLIYYSPSVFFEVDYDIFHKEQNDDLSDFRTV